MKCQGGGWGWGWGGEAGGVNKIAGIRSDGELTGLEWGMRGLGLTVE